MTNIAEPVSADGRCFLAGPASTEQIESCREGFARDGYALTRATPVYAPVAGVWIEVWRDAPETPADFSAQA